MEVIYSGISEAGLRRKINQDAILMYSDEDRKISIFIVADGMGGHTMGEVASNEIVSGIKGWVEDLSVNECEDGFSSMINLLQERLREINKSIYTNYNIDTTCGSTCILLFIYGQDYAIINVGDSHIYCRHGRKVECVMEDDVWENQRLVREKLSSKEIKKHPNYGKLIKAMGVKEKVEFSVKTGRLEKDTAFLLCSDGLYKYCSIRLCNKILRRITAGNMKDSVAKLLGEVYKKGAGDNVSVILVQCLK